MTIALDATYSLGSTLSGVGVYSREILHGLAEAHPEQQFRWCYRPHRMRQSWREHVPRNVWRSLLYGPIGPWRADLFHGLNQRLPEARSRRTVCTFHDLFVLTEEYSTREFRERFAAQASAAAARADLMIAVSQFTAGQMEALLNVEARRLRVVPHGVHAPAPAQVPPLESREPMILHVGAIQRRKNIARLLRAFRQLPPPWRLVLAGSMGYGADELREELQRTDRVEVLGYVDEKQLQQLYRRARVLAFPSLDEGFGIPVLEAMAWGVPVLTSNRSALPEAAGGAALLVDPFQEEEIAEGLRRLTDQEWLAAELVTRGREHAERYSWQVAVEGTWAVYRELL